MSWPFPADLLQIFSHHEVISSHQPAAPADVAASDRRCPCREAHRCPPPPRVSSSSPLARRASAARRRATSRRRGACG